MATEPRTKAIIIDETIGLGNDPVDTNLNILCPIISPTGPTKLTRVTGPSMLRRFFNGGSAITPESSLTLQYARAVSAQAPLYIKRASRSEIRAGRTSTTYATEFYIDQLNNVLSGGILELTQNIPADKSYSTYLSALTTPTENTSIEKTDELVYVSMGQLSTAASKLLKKSTKYLPIQGNYVKFVGDVATTSDVIVTINNRQYVIEGGSSNLNSLLTDMIDAGEKPIAVAGTKVYYDSTATSGQFTPEDDTVVTMIILNNSVTLNGYEEDLEKIVRTGDTITAFYINSIMSETEYNDSFITDPFSIKIVAGSDGKKYHIHTIDVPYDTTQDVDIKIPSDLTFLEVCEAIYDDLDIYLTIGSKSTTNFIIEGLTEVTSESSVVIESETVDTVLSASLDSIFSQPTSDLFGIISKFPNVSDLISVRSVDNGNDTYTLTINAFNDEEVFTISFIPGAVDGYGNDIYYTTVEDNSDYVSIVPLGGTQVASDTTFRIGGGVTNEFVGVKELTSTLEEMMDTEESPVLFDYILDGGVVDNSYSAMIIQACEYYKSFYPASCQTNEMSVYNMKNNRSRLGNGQQSCRVNFIASAQRDSVLDSGLCVMPASYYYLRSRIGLAQSVKEFTAIFGKDNGNIGIINPIKDYKRSDRESMLDSQIITLKRSMSDGSWYLNLNMTCYGIQSYLQEDGIVLMNNKISQITMLYAEPLKGEYNTPELRSKVTGELTQMINTRLRVGTAYGPDSITVICDDSNNTKSTIAQHKLIIDVYGRFANSIRDVLIYQHVQPLEG